MKLRGVPILGSTDALEEVVKQMEAKGMRPASLIITESSERLRGPAMLRLVTQAESLGLKVACLPKLAEFEHGRVGERSEEHTSEHKSLMRKSYAVFCLKKKNTNQY